MYIGNIVHNCKISHVGILLFLRFLQVLQGKNTCQNFIFYNLRDVRTNRYSRINVMPLTGYDIDPNEKVTKCQLVLTTE